MYKQINSVKVKLTDEEVLAETKRTQDWDAKINERQLDLIRSQRVPLLLESDFQINILEDAGKDTSQYRKYRQELRDITKSNSDPFKITFPQKP